MSVGQGLFALSAMSAVGQIVSGNAKAKEAEANARLIESKNKLSYIQQDIEQGRYVAQGSKMIKQAQATIGSSNLGFGGSSIAFLNEQLRQLNIDKAISKFESEADRTYTTAEAAAERRRGTYERAAGYGNAFSSLLKAGYAYAAYSGAFDKPIFKKKED